MTPARQKQKGKARGSLAWRHSAKSDKQKRWENIKIRGKQEREDLINKVKLLWRLSVFERALEWYMSVESTFVEVATRGKKKSFSVCVM